MKSDDVKPGLRVFVRYLHAYIEEGYLTGNKHVLARKVGIKGTVLGHAIEHGGGVWWVQHDDSEDLGVYTFLELEPLDESDEKMIREILEDDYA